MEAKDGLYKQIILRLEAFEIWITHVDGCV